MSVLERLKRSLAFYRERGEDQRSRIIYHAKRGAKASRLRRAYERTKAMIASRRRSLRRHSDTRQTAVRWALAQVGTVEKPAGSNRGGRITDWQKRLGQWLVGLAWCGVFCANACLNAGVKIAQSWRWASVAYIEDDARAARNGFKGWRHGPGAGQAGDLIVVFGRGVHVELIERRVTGGYRTIGGNTSAGASGSQSNGGGVYRRFRPDGHVHGIAFVDY